MANQQSPNIKPIAPVTNLSAVACAKAAVTATKPFEPFPLEMVCRILLAVCESILQQIATSTRHQKRMQGIILVLTGTFLSHERIYAPKVFYKTFCVTRRIKMTHGTPLRQRKYCYNFDNVTYYVTLHRTVNGNRGSQFVA